MNSFERSLIDSPKLPTMPAVAQRLLELLNDGDQDLSALADVISRDPALAVKIIRLINSPFYGMSREVTSLQTAVLYLGYQSVRSVALSFSLFATFKAKPDQRDRFLQLWRTSLMMGLAARRISNETGTWDPDEAFLAGLIADCGSLLLLQSTPHYAEVLDRFVEGEDDLIGIEESEIQTTHTRLAGFLLEKWRFPTSIRELVENHHGPVDSKSDSILTTRIQILQAAWLYARTLTIPGFSSEIRTLDHIVAELTNIPVPIAKSLAEELPQEFRSMAELFDISPMEQKTYEQLLENANDVLSELALDADESARILADAIARRKDDFAGIDGICEEDFEQDTGLLSRPAFERLTEAFHRRALTTRRSLGMMILEIRDLKVLEEAKGPRAVIETLGKVAELVSKQIRRSDHLCHFGEHQLAILLPGCGSEDLMRSAERIRLSVETEALGVTEGSACDIAIGVASADPHADAVDPYALMQFACGAADRAARIAERIVLGP